MTTISPSNHTSSRRGFLGRAAMIAAAPTAAAIVGPKLFASSAFADDGDLPSYAPCRRARSVPH